MTADLWVEMLSGTFAAVVGLVGVFIAFVLTSRHDRRLAVEQRDAERQAAAQREEDAALERLRYRALLLAPGTAWAFLTGNRAALELLDAAIAFSMAHQAHRPALSLWVVEQTRRIQDAQRSWMWWRVVPGVSHRRARAFGAEVAALTTAVMGWSAGERDEAWFRQRLTRG